MYICEQIDLLMKNLVFLILLFPFSLTFGQTEYFKIENVSKDSDFAFPIIYSDDSLITLKINTHLQLAELELLKGYERRNIFEKVSINDGRIYGGRVSILYQILQNTKNVFSVQFDESSCGMTCAYWKIYLPSCGISDSRTLTETKFYLSQKTPSTLKTLISLSSLNSLSSLTINKISVVRDFWLSYLYLE